MSLRVTRRKFNALVGASILTVPMAARAQTGGRLVVGSWGGDTQRLLTELVFEPYLEPAGIQVAYDPAAEAARKTKILAERPLPRGSLDIAGMQPPSSLELHAVGALEEIDQDRISAFDRILPELRSPYFIPQFFSSRVILYNPEKVTTPPTSYSDLWDPAYAGRVGVIDIQYQSTIESAALVAGGSVSDYEPGKEKLLELKEMGVKVYPTNEAMAQALASGECWMCIMWQARGVMWQDAGIPIEIAYPSEGLALSVFGFAIPKNAQNKDSAYAFMNAVLEDGAQIGFAENQGYNPSVSGITLPDELEKRIQIPPELEANMLAPDLEYLRENDYQLKNWWDREFKS